MRKMEYVDILRGNSKESIDELFEIREIIMESLGDVFEVAEEDAKLDGGSPCISEKDFRVLKDKELGGYVLNVPKAYTGLVLVIGAAYLTKTNPETDVEFIDDLGIAGISGEISYVEEYIDSHKNNTNL